MGTGDASSVGHVASAAGGSAWKSSRSGPCRRARIDMHPTVPFRSLAAVWPDRPVTAGCLEARVASSRRGTWIRLRNTHTMNGSCPTRDVRRPGAVLTPSHRPRLRTGHSALLGGWDAHPATGGLLWPAPLVVVRPIAVSYTHLTL